MPKLLLVEDDLILQDLIVEFFTDNSYCIRYCSSYPQAMEYICKEAFDLLILDVKIEEGNGFALLKELRGLGIEVPVIFTTSLHDIADLEKGFYAGCNDYLKKPYALKELLLRVKVLLKDRFITAHESLKDGFVFDHCSMLLTQHSVVFPLSKKEAKLLSLFLTHKNRLLTIETIFSELWDFEEPSFLSLRAYVKNIRKILGKNRLINKRGEGYMFVQ